MLYGNGEGEITKCGKCHSQTQNFNEVTTAKEKRKHEADIKASTMREVKLCKLDSIEQEEKDILSHEQITRGSEAFKKDESLFQPLTWGC